jgi:hypothetical protein
VELSADIIPPCLLSRSCNLLQKYVIYDPFSEQNIKMSSLEYYSTPGWGEYARENYHYSEAVRVGDTLYLAGQGTVFTFSSS